MDNKPTYEELERRVRSLEQAAARQKAEEAPQSREGVYRQLVEGAEVFLSAFDPYGVCLYCNRKVARQFGGEPSDIIGKTFRDLHPEQGDEYIRRIRETIDSGEVREYHDQVQFPEGERWFVTSLHPIRESDGRIAAVQIVSQDFTASRMAEEAHRESEGRYRAVTESSTDLISLFDLEGNLIFTNPAGAEMYGYEREEMTGMHFSSFLTKERLHKAEELFQRALAGERVQGELLVKHKKGHEFPISLGLVQTKRGDEVVGFTAVSQDITERRKMEERLLESENRLRLFISNFPGVAFISDPGKCLLLANDRLTDFYGLEGTEIIGRNFKEYVPPDFYSKIVEQDRLVVSENRTLIVEETVPHTSGSSEWLTYKFPIVQERGPVLVGGFGIDITQRKQAEEALQKSERNLIQAQQVGKIGSWEWNIQTGEVHWSVEMYSLHGQDPSNFTPTISSILALTHPDDQDLVQAMRNQIASEAVSIDFDYRVIRPDGEIRTFEAVGHVTEFDEVDNPRLMVGVARDITESKRLEEERKRLESRLLQAQKMEAIGTLAGGIAHDFNNILAIITGFAEMAVLEAPEGSELRAHLDEVLIAGLRGKEVTKQILAFSRQSTPEMKPVDIVPVMQQSKTFLRSLLPTTIEIRQDIQVDPAVILGDSTQIHQVLLNLGTNASYAMRERGGTLDISLTEVDLTYRETILKPDLMTGPHLKIEVRDSGVGIRQEIRDRIFEPFFTSKETGQGTGMGLSVVHGIVKSHRGDISVETELGKGTAFHILLPCLKSVPEKMEAVSPKKAPTGQGRILFVDDERRIVDFGMKMLERLGYDVVPKTSSVEALEAFRANPMDFDAVITDMTMPKMTGRGLSREILKIRPDIPIVVCTGFSEKVSPETAREAGFREMLMKPFSLDNLAKTLRNVLGPE